MPPQDATQAKQALNDALCDPLQTPNNVATNVITWVVSIFHLFLAYVEARFIELRARVLDIENCPAHAPIATTTPAVTSDPQTRKICCTKCHASNHIAEYCRTVNPAAMRKRIATNQKKKKSARAIAAAATTLPPFPPMPPPFPYYASTPVLPDPQVVSGTGWPG